MTNFKELLAESEEAAAGAVEDGLRHLINAYVPGITLTKEEFKELFTIIREGRSKDPAEYFRDKQLKKDPPDPNAGKFKLTVKHVINGNDPGVVAPKTIEEYKRKGDSVHIIPQPVPGYLPDKSEIDVVMDKNIEIIVTYNKIGG